MTRSIFLQDKKSVFKKVAIIYFALSFSVATFAQTTTNTNPNTNFGAGVQTNFNQNSTEYDNSTILELAQKQCSAAITGKGLSSIFDSGASFATFELPTAGGGGSAVSANDAMLRNLVRQSISVEQEIRRLLAERNFSEDCYKSIALAKSIQSIKKALEKDQKKLADNNANDPKKVAGKEANKSVKINIEAEKTANTGYTSIAIRTVGKAIGDEYGKKNFTLSPEQVDKCSSGKCSNMALGLMEMNSGNNPVSYTMTYIEKVSVDSANASYEVIDEGKRNGGIIGNRRCTKTTSGADPEETEFDDDDCSAWVRDPSIINQEKVKQLINAPYNQAFSSSAELGIDGGLANINQRILSGKLFEKNIGSNFTSGGAGASTDLTDAEKNKNALLNNISLAIEVEKALITLHSSSTSPCAYVPLADRAAVITESSTNVVTYTTAKNEIESKWAQVIANKNADHTNFFINMSIQLSNKWNKDLIQKLVDKFKAKAQICIDTKAATLSNISTFTATSTASTTNTN